MSDGLPHSREELKVLTDAAYDCGRNAGLDGAAQAIQPDVLLVYTGPGGFDPEPIQKKCVETILALKDKR